MLEPPKVSIIVPVYNVEKYIERCARSIFEQTYDNLEIIFVNDCTTDGSIDVLNRVATEYPQRISCMHIITHDRNRGLAAARRTGILTCSGKYVVNCDSDDYLEMSAITTLTCAAVDGNLDIVASPLFIDRAEGNVYIEKIKDAGNFFDLNAIPIDTQHFSLCNKIFRTELLKPLTDAPDINCWEDLAISARAIALARKTNVIDTPLYHYRMSGDSLSAQAHSKRLHDQIAVARFVETWFIANHHDKQYATFLRNLKFTSKIKYLRGNKRNFAAWKSTFPETNSHILGYRNIPLHYRLLFSIANMLPTWLTQSVADLFSSKSDLTLK